MALSKERSGRITGSITGAILGVSPFMTRQNVMINLVKDHYGIALTDISELPPIKYGTNMEPYALECFGVTPSDQFFKYEEWLGATPDGFLNDLVVEVKCPYRHRKLEDPDGFQPIEELPHYYSQVQIELLCSGKTKALFAQWSPYCFKKEIVEVDNDWLKTNLPILKDFWDEFMFICLSDKIPSFIKKREYYD